MQDRRHKQAARGTAADGEAPLADRPASRLGTAVSLGELLGGAVGGNTGSPLGRLAAAASARVALLDFLRDGLAAELRDQLLACNLRADGTLVLTAASPAWSARLRFEGPTLLARCRERHPETAAVRVRTAAGGGQAPAATGSP